MAKKKSAAETRAATIKKTVRLLVEQLNEKWNRDGHTDDESMLHAALREHETCVSRRETREGHRAYFAKAAAAKAVADHDRLVEALSGPQSRAPKAGT